jgi:hypothetical protein
MKKPSKATYSEQQAKSLRQILTGLGISFAGIPTTLISGPAGFAVIAGGATLAAKGAKGILVEEEEFRKKELQMRRKEREKLREIAEQERNRKKLEKIL